MLPTHVHDLKGRQPQLRLVHAGHVLRPQVEPRRVEERALSTGCSSAPGAPRHGPAQRPPGRRSTDRLPALVRSFQDDSEIDPHTRRRVRACAGRRDAGAELEGRPASPALRGSLASAFRAGTQRMPLRRPRRAQGVHRRAPRHPCRDVRSGRSSRTWSSSTSSSASSTSSTADDPASPLARHLFEYPASAARAPPLGHAVQDVHAHRRADDDHYVDFLRHRCASSHDDAAATAELRESPGGLPAGALPPRRRGREPSGGSRLRSSDALAGDGPHGAPRGDRRPQRHAGRGPGRRLRLDARDLRVLSGAPAGGAKAVDHGDTLEYWKSAPYLLNFMDDYKLKMR